MVNGVFASLKLVKCSHLANSDVSTGFLHVIGHPKPKHEDPKGQRLVRILVVVPMVSTEPPHEAVQSLMWLEAHIHQQCTEP